MAGSTSPGSSSTSAASYPGLIRLLAAILTLGIGTLILWQAGILFQTKDDAGADTVSLLPAEPGIETPQVAGVVVGLKEGNLAPDFAFSAFDGRRMRLSELRGRPVLLNFWATWCGPCRTELPDMEAMQRRYEQQGFAVVAMNSGQRLKTADRFIKELDVQLTAFGYDPRSDIAKRYAVEGWPTSYFIDARGVIVKVVWGQLTKTIMESGAQAALGN